MLCTVRKLQFKSKVFENSRLRLFSAVIYMCAVVLFSVNGLKSHVRVEEGER